MKTRLILFIIFLVSLIAVVPASAGNPQGQTVQVKQQAVKSDPCIGKIPPAYAQVVTTTTESQNTTKGGQTHNSYILDRVKTWPSGTQQSLTMTQTFDGNAVSKEACLQAANGHCSEFFVTEVSVVCSSGAVLMSTRQTCTWSLHKGVETSECIYE